ncbi:TIGR01666 family membrane protein [Neptunitalea chrysea]|uniref:TIGR01666 family membrane protein n=1 Tax=Neptunitalea chrysea TaxID=1647581 RepID=A0A9W6B2Q3_9FLAO|nr:FUSC family membrane protein [Neptunitalea chrysea]GLB51176.1 TIGR01666 family membrane protein [Neptunitalea chrysea]
MEFKTKQLEQLVRTLWIEKFWTKPNNFWALKVLVSIAFLLIPCVIAGYKSVGATLALGVVAMALSETDVHPRAKLKSIIFTYICFVFVAVSVELLRLYPLPFGIWLAVFTFMFTLIGGHSARFQGITYGCILVAVYTMLGAGYGNPWYFQPVIMPLGGLIYAVISISIAYKHPWRLLEEQIASGYTKIAEYIALKAELFPSTKEQQQEIRNELALKNIDVSQKINLIKNDLYSFGSESSEESLPRISTFFNRWYVLQEIQRRATSSHEEYYILSETSENSELITGLGQLMQEVAKATQIYADSILTETTYQHPVSLIWTKKALEQLFQQHKGSPQYTALSLLFINVSRLEEILRMLDDKEPVDMGSRADMKDKVRTVPFRQLLNPRSLRFRHATRLMLCLVLGYMLKYYFHFEKGDWILLTSMLVLQQTYSATRQRIFYRILGTIIGVILGISIAHIMANVQGQILMLLLSVYLFFKFVRTNYTIAVVFITTFVLEIFDILGNIGVLVMQPRLIDTLIGAALAYLSIRFLWPNWSYKQLPNLLETAVGKNKRYFDSIYTPNIDYNTYLHYQRSANNADNQLTEAWRGMRLEPKGKQKLLESARNFTYYNHSLLSYISAFGTHHYNGQLSEEKQVYCHRISELLEAIHQHRKEEKINFKQVSEKSEKLVKELYDFKEATPHSSAVILYNIARITNELLWETRELM